MREAFSEFISLLKQKNDITEVIGSYIKLERRGNNYWACCPFHHEKTASFSINAPEQYYHCFGCGASGDVIGFVKEYENVGFSQAVQILASRVGLEVPEIDDKMQEEVRRKKQIRDRLLSLTKDAARFYLSTLYSGKAQEHLEYLNRRRVSPSVMKKFGLGASIDSKSLPMYLREKGYTEKEMEQSGVCVSSERGKLTDAQAGRLIIPIINNLDEVIAFGGRTLARNPDRAKYKNTKDTLLFDKRKNLYNINLVKRLHRESKIPYLIMVEGYMDAISLYQAGFQNVVASMGTSLTREQLRLAKRYSENLYISYDGDFAGQKANLRGLSLAAEEGLKVKIVPLPEGPDPDDIIREGGAEAYQTLLDEAMPLPDYKLLAAKRKYDLNDTNGRREYVGEALKIIRESESAAEREELLKRLSQETELSLGALERDLERAPEIEKTPPPEPVRTEQINDKIAERFVLAACLFNKPYAEKFAIEKLVFSDPTQEKIAEYISEERESAGKVRPSGVFDLQLEGDREISLILDLATGSELDGESAEKFFSDCVAVIGRKNLSDRIEECKAAYEKAQTAQEKREILEILGELTKKQR